jgi:hypothetical protein
VHARAQIKKVPGNYNWNTKGVKIKKKNNKKKLHFKFFKKITIKKKSVKINGTLSWMC